MKVTETTGLKTIVGLPALRHVIDDRYPTERNHGWHSIKDLRQCIASILNNKGCHCGESLTPQKFLRTFDPGHEQFAWYIHYKNTDKWARCEGTVVECEFDLAYDSSIDVYVPSGWGNGIARIANNLGVVWIEGTLSHGWVSARQWNNTAEIDLAPSEQLWRKK